MLSITDKAAQHLAILLESESVDPSIAIRVVGNPGGWHVRLDQQAQEDQVFEHGDRTILVLRPAVAAALHDAILDVEEGESRPKLCLRSGAASRVPS